MDDFEKAIQEAYAEGWMDAHGPSENFPVDALKCDYYASKCYKDMLEHRNKHTVYFGADNAAYSANDRAKAADSALSPQPDLPNQKSENDTLPLICPHCTKHGHEWDYPTQNTGEK